METNAFTVESIRHCFICLNQIPSHFSDSSGVALSDLSIHSLWSLSSYLKMDMGKVFNDNDSIPQHLLAKVRKSKLKGELCDECSLMNDKFSELYWKLIKNEMELLSCLNLFQSKFLAANGTGKCKALRNQVVASSGEWTEKLDILEVLRAEAIHRCYMRLNGKDTPRVKVQNLTMQQVVEEKQKFRKNSSIMKSQHPNYEAAPASDIGYRNVKIEDIIDDRNEIDDSYYSDNVDDMMFSSDAVERPSTSPVKPKIEKVNKKIGYGEDLNVNHSYEVVIPPESRDIEKPQPSVNPESGKHKCNLCPSEFTSKFNFNGHYKSVHLKVKYKCTICGVHFSELSKYNRHHRNIHLGIRFKCLQCNEIFKLKFQLTAHQRKHKQ